MRRPRDPNIMQIAAETVGQRLVRAMSRLNMHSRTQLSRRTRLTRATLDAIFDHGAIPGPVAMKRLADVCLVEVRWLEFADANSISTPACDGLDDVGWHAVRT